LSQGSRDIYVVKPKKKEQINISQIIVKINPARNSAYFIYYELSQGELTLDAEVDFHYDTLVQTPEADKISHTLSNSV
jgi:hypothetical protein